MDVAEWIRTRHLDRTHIFRMMKTQPWEKQVEPNPQTENLYSQSVSTELTLTLVPIHNRSLQRPKQLCDDVIHMCKLLIIPTFWRLLPQATWPKTFYTVRMWGWLLSVTQLQLSRTLRSPQQISPARTSTLTFLENKYFFHLVNAWVLTCLQEWEMVLWGAQRSCQHK